MTRLPDSVSSSDSQHADRAVGVNDTGETDIPPNGILHQPQRPRCRLTPADAAAKIRQQPGRLHSIIHELQQSFGNSFVQEVLAELHREPEQSALSTLSTDSPSPAGSNHSHAVPT